MTAQASDEIQFRDEDYFLFSEPLEAYFLKFYPSGAKSESEEFEEWYRSVDQSRLRPPFRMRDTGCVRGYIAKWAIIEGKLYLHSLRGWFYEGEVGIEAVFPDSHPPVFAWWYTGPLRLQKGQIVNYVHLGYLSEFETQVLLDVREGCVVGERYINRAVSPT